MMRSGALISERTYFRDPSAEQCVFCIAAMQTSDLQHERAKYLRTREAMANGVLRQLCG
jgi:hypothetical protein